VNGLENCWLSLIFLVLSTHIDSSCYVSVHSFDIKADVTKYPLFPGLCLTAVTRSGTTV